MSQPRTKRITAVIAATAAAAALAGLALSTTANADSTPAALAAPLASAIAAAKASPPAVPVPTPTGSVAPVPADPRSRIVGSGELGGSTWSVTLTYYPTVPADYAPGERTAGRLVCLRTTVDGTASSRYGDCAGVKNPTDPAPRGMYGEHTLPNGAALFIAQPPANVASATMTFTDAAPTTVTTATIPGTAFSAYAVPVPATSHMHALDEYDSSHHPVGHQNL